MLKNIQSLGIWALCISILACTPKAGDKGATPISQNTPSGAAPQIPIPSGEVRKQAPKPGAAPVIQIGKAATFELENGLKVIVVENHKLPKVSFRVFSDYDNVLEKDAAGYVDVMGDLLTKGTATRSKQQIDEAVDFIGASLSGNPNGITGNCLSKHSEKLLELMSDVLLNPSFPQEEFDKSKKQLESALASQKSEPNAIISNVGARLRYGAMHPYGEFVTEKTLKNIQLEQIKKHYATFIKPNVSYLVITGDITRTKAEQYAKKYFGKWQKAEVPTVAFPTPRPPEKTQVHMVDKAGAVQSVINITYPVDLMPGTEEAIKVRVLNTVLGGYFNSRVNANLREGHGWTYGANTSLSPDKLVGAFTASASVRTAVTDSAIIEFMKEMEKIRTEKIPQAELQVVKNVLTGQFARNLETPGTVAEFALNTARYKIPADYYEQYLNRLNAVTSEELLALAKKYIRPDRAHILVVGNKAEIADRLKSLSTEGKVNFWSTDGEPVKAIQTELPPNVNAQTVIQDYLNAIGGMAEINKIQDIQTTVGMKSRGMEITVKQIQKGGMYLMQEMSMGAQSMGKTILNKDKAIQTGIGGASRPIEGEELAELKEQAAIIKEALYLGKDYRLALKGIEEVNGKAAYLVEVTHPGGTVSSEYFEVASSLKLRDVSYTKAPDGAPITVSNDYENYKAVNGVKFPHATLTTGVFPMPMKSEVKEIKINAGVEDALFEIK